MTFAFCLSIAIPFVSHNELASIECRTPRHPVGIDTSDRPWQIACVVSYLLYNNNKEDFHSSETENIYVIIMAES